MTRSQRARSAAVLNPAEVQARYLELYSGGLSSGESALAAGVSLATISRWKMADPEFEAAWHKAYDEFTHTLEAKAERMAAEATPMSATMLIFMLKARKPNVYRESIRAELTGKDGGPIEVRHNILREVMELIGSNRAALEHEG